MHSDEARGEGGLFHVALSQLRPPHVPKGGSLVRGVAGVGGGAKESMGSGLLLLRRECGALKVYDWSLSSTLCWGFGSDASLWGREFGWGRGTGRVLVRGPKEEGSGPPRREASARARRTPTRSKIPC